MNRSKFFAALYPAKTQLLVVIAKRGPKTQEKKNGAFIPLSSELVTAAELDKREWDHLPENQEAFFAPMPMKREPANIMPQLRDAATRGRVVWCDADGGLTDGTRSWLADEMGAALVRSGGIAENGLPRYHVYLRLDRLTPVHHIEALNLALAKKIDHLNGFTGTDMGKCHRASILRVPGTINRKHRDECPMGCTGGHSFGDGDE